MSPKVTILDVARASGFGVGTVSRVLSGEPNVKESTRKRVMEVVQMLHYVPNANAIKLRKRHNGLIAVLVPLINHPFFAEFVECLGEVAGKNNYSVILVTSRRNIDEEHEILRKVRMREVDGAIFATHYDHTDDEVDGLNLVSIDRHLNRHVPFVTSDNYDATKAAIEYLLSTGAQRIGFIGTKPHVDSEVAYRAQAYLNVMAEHNLEPRIVNEVVEHGEEARVVDEFLERYPDVDAIFASGNSISNLVYARLKERNVSFPDQMQLISYDGVFNTWGGDETISTIQQPIKELAEASFRILLELIQDKEVAEKNVFKTTFIKGTTTR